MVSRPAGLSNHAGSLQNNQDCRHPQAEQAQGDRDAGADALSAPTFSPIILHVLFKYMDFSFK